MTRHHDTSSIQHDIEHLSPQELRNLHGIEFIQDPDVKRGPVWDTITGKEYPSIAAWAAEADNEEDWSEDC